MPMVMDAIMNFTVIFCLGYNLQIGYDLHIKNMKK